jgi:hypothetical protein
LEEAIWRATVDALPQFWVDGAGCLVLRRLVCQAAIAEQYEARLRRLRRDSLADTEDAVELAMRHAAVAKSVAYLLGQLRATPRTRDASKTRVAGTAISEVPAFRPWEVEAEKNDATLAQ